MYPTLRKGDYVCVDTYKAYTPVRGDIVALYDPTMPGDNIVKRIVGIPRDLIEVKPNYILINGIKENEDFLNHKGQIFYKHIGTLVLKNNEYFVLGDNRNRSFDSIEFGPVPESDIIGKVKRIYWPPSRMGKVK
jgi:signal peptidase I